MSYPGLIVLRYGELFLKGGNRRAFERLLRRNVERALDGAANTLERGQGRLFARCEQTELPRLTRRLQRVFGLSSVSPALPATIDHQDIDGTIKHLAEVAAAIIEQRARPATFKVETRRADKRFPLTSIEISQRVGGLVAERTSITPSMHHPELGVGIEIGQQASFVFVDRLPGAGGLPVGCEGRVALLLSGGIDSPIAGHLMQKRGCELVAIYFHSPPYTSTHAQDKVVQLGERLAIAQGGLRLLVVPFTEIQCDIRDNAPPRLAVLLYRRMMMRIANALARRHDALALATGENLGQVASQTLHNLACIEQASELPILRPLLSYDKHDTIALARELGTFEISTLPHEDCCSLFVPKHPETRGDPLKLARAERELDSALLDAAVERTERIDL